jgi:cytochrome c biogenesis factor
MVIHPPVVFVAYGVLVVPFAAALAHLLTGRKEWTVLSVDWARIGWLFLTAGIGIGGLWAYVVLGWGGYWGWDPIETSSLLPWMLLTGFLHALHMYKRKGDYPLLAPLLGIFTFILVVFATFATRAAGLWVSVHTFGSADPNISVWVRLANLMDESKTSRIYLIFMIIAVFITVILAYKTYRERRRSKADEDQYITLSELMNDDMLMFGSILLLIVSTIITMLILIGGINGLTGDNFNTPVGVLAIGGVLLLTVCLIWRDLGRKRMAQVAGGTALLAICAGIAVPDYFAAASTIPVLLVGLVGSIYKIAKSFKPGFVLPSLSLTSAHLVHLSVVLILLGYVGSNFLQEEESVSLTVGGSAEEFAGYSFKATDFKTSSEELWVEVEVWKGNKLLGTERPGRINIPNPLSGEQRIRSEVKVVDTLGEDVYLIFGSSSVSGVSNVVDVTVTILPLMKVLWMGMYLMMFGILVRALTDGLLRRRRAKRGLTPAGEAIEDPDLAEEASDADGYDEDADYYSNVASRRGSDEEPGEEPDEEPGEEPDEVPVIKKPKVEEHDDSYYEDLLEKELKRI